MNRKTFRPAAFTLIITLLLAASTGGCVSLAVETGSQVYSHLRGDLQAIVPDQLPDAYEAAVLAIDKLDGYSMTDKHLDTLTGHITGYDRQDRELCIDLFRTEHDQTRMQIRIGWVGDRLESVMVYDQIHSQLPSYRNR